MKLANTMPAESTTGATAEQIEAAIKRLNEDRLSEHVDAIGHAIASAVMDAYAVYLVPPDHRLIGPAAIAAIGRVVEHTRFFDGQTETCPLVTDADLALLSALVDGTS